MEKDITNKKESDNKLIEADAINKGLFDLDEGKIIDGNIVLDELKNKYGF